jgi:hypothetical protein
MKQELFDHQVQEQLNVVNGILAATIQDQKATRELISAVNALCKKVDVRLTSLAAEVRGSAEETACKAAHLLEKHFTAVDKAAENARIRYEHATQGLNLKVFGIQAAAFLAVALVVAVLVERQLRSPLERQLS